MAPNQTNSTDWSQFTRDGLKIECEKRSLPKSGTKSELIEHLKKFEISAKTANATSRSQQVSTQSISARSHLIDRSSDSHHDSGNAVNFTHSYIVGLSEERLEQICRDSWLPHTQDPSGIQRRATIRAEYNLKTEDFIKTRNKSLDKAREKYDKELNEARLERDDRLKEVETEVRPNEMKRKAWGPAFNQLKVSKNTQKAESWWVWLTHIGCLGSSFCPWIGDSDLGVRAG